jgi:hypothetical protein
VALDVSARARSVQSPTGHALVRIHLAVCETTIDDAKLAELSPKKVKHDHSKTADFQALDPGRLALHGSVANSVV